MNECFFSGNLVSDPRLSVTSKGVSVCKLRIAINRHFQRSNGDFAEEVAFISAEAWDSGANRIAEKFKKGSRIYFTASVKQNTWETKDGEKRSEIVFRINKFSEYKPTKNGKYWTFNYNAAEPVGVTSDESDISSDETVSF